MSKKATPKKTAAKKVTSKKKTAATKATPKKTTTKKSPVKKTSAKKTSTKKIPVEKKPTSTNPTRRTCGLPLEERVDRFVETLAKLGATSATTARTKSEISNSDGTLTEYDCYYLTYPGTDKTPPNTQIVKKELIKPAKIEGQAQLAYYLTANGKKYVNSKKKK